MQPKRKQKGRRTWHDWTKENPKKIGYIHFDLWAVTYVTIVNLLPQKQILTHTEAVHNHFLNELIGIHMIFKAVLFLDENVLFDM